VNLIPDVSSCGSGVPVYLFDDHEVRLMVLVDPTDKKTDQVIGAKVIAPAFVMSFFNICFFS
jgi:hypothetical protein